MLKYLFILILLSTQLCLSAQETLSDDTLHWSESRPLSWDDFKGEVIEGVGLGGEIFCMNMANFNRPSAFHKIRFEVVALFDRQISWANEEMRTDQGLLYFQTIFNIYEVHARELRKDLAESKFGLDPNPLFQEKFNRSNSKLMQEYNAFRRETKMGTDQAAIEKWNTNIEAELQALEEYK